MVYTLYECSVWGFRYGVGKPNPWYSHGKPYSCITNAMPCSKNSNPLSLVPSDSSAPAIYGTCCNCLTALHGQKQKRETKGGEKCSQMYSSLGVFADQWLQVPEFNATSMHFCDICQIHVKIGLRGESNWTTHFNSGSHTWEWITQPADLLCCDGPLCTEKVCISASIYTHSWAHYFQFHLSCQGLLERLAGGWFCDSDCKENAGFRVRKWSKRWRTAWNVCTWLVDYTYGLVYAHKLLLCKVTTAHNTKYGNLLTQLGRRGRRGGSRPPFQQKSTSSAEL